MSADKKKKAKNKGAFVRTPKKSRADKRKKK